MILTSFHTKTVCLVFAAGLSLAACSNGDDVTTTTTTDAPPTTSAPAPITAAPTTAAPDDTTATTEEPALSQAEQDAADVEATLQAFEAARMAAMRGEESIEGIYPYSRDTAREKWVTQVMAYDAQGLTITGDTQFEVVEFTVEDDSAEVLTCTDVSEVEVTDEKGKPAVAEDRLDRTLKEFVLERDDSAEFGWYVTDDVNLNEPCDD